MIIKYKNKIYFLKIITISSKNITRNPIHDSSSSIIVKKFHFCIHNTIIQFCK